MKFSANLGFLWTDLPLPRAIRAAKSAGFDAVECHGPHATRPAEALRALQQTGLPMLSLNTTRGDTTRGEFGLAALPGRERQARRAIDAAIAWAAATGTQAVHVLAGNAHGESAHDTFTANLHHACTAAEPHGITILIEPLNPHDAPGYFLNSTARAEAILTALALPNLKLMFDCYHVARLDGDVIARLDALWPLIGHIQFAGVPHRGRPDTGDVDYAQVFAHLAARGWTRPLGAEYRPGGPTERSLGWMQTLRT